MAAALLPPLQGWLLLAGVVILVGALAWRAGIAPRLDRGLDREAAAALETRLVRTGRRVALALLPVWGLRLYVQLQGFRDPFAPLAEDLALLVFETFWGRVWMVQGALLLAVAGVLAFIARPVLHPRGAVPWAAAGAGVLLLVLTLSLSSHAMSAPQRVIAVAADALHTLAAGVWIGTLALILVLPPPGPLRGPSLAVQLRAFSPLAMAAVGGLVAMGVYLSVTHVGTPSALGTSAYGRILVAKILLAAGALRLGFLNFRALPILDTAAGSRTISRRAALEVAVGAVVLAVTAILVGRTRPS